MELEQGFRGKRENIGQLCNIVMYKSEALPTDGQ